MTTQHGHVPQNIKMCLCGAENSGKTSLLLQFLNKEFLDEDDPTIEDSHNVSLSLEGKECTLDILDTGGSSAYEHLHEKWFGWAEAFIIVYNITLKYTFDMVPNYFNKIQQIKKNNLDEISIVLVGSQIDKEEKRVISTEAGLEFAYDNGLLFFETSAKDGKNVTKVFKELIKDIRQRRKELLLLESYFQIQQPTETKKKRGINKGKDYDNALSIMKDPKRREEITSSVPVLKVAPLKKKIELANIRGPPSDESEQKYEDFISAKSISTYPKKGEGNKREGDPICDQYCLSHFSNRTIFSLADGCNWGDEPRNAAQKAVRVFEEYMKKHQRDIKYTTDVINFMLRAYLTAHNTIIEGRTEETIFLAGTTTMLGGMILEIEPDAKANSRWAFICLSLGDCKAYIWSHKTGQVTEITEGNRQNITDARDPGGRIGPYLDKGAPDLRNLGAYWYPCEKGDIVIVVTDGVYDNFDPQHLGKSPQELKVPGGYQTWQEIDNLKDDEVIKEAEKIKNLFIKRFINAMIGGEKSTKPENKTSPSLFVNKLTDHCLKLTKPSRDFMEQNPTIPLPKDYNKYPGKMDHTTCVAFKIGFGEIKKAPTHTEGNQKSLMDDWEEYKTDAGEIYFYNKVTGKSTWEDPWIDSGDWKAYYDDEGDVYFYNSKTNESCWELPKK